MKNGAPGATLNRLLLTFIAIIFFLSCSFAQTKWKGTTSTDWFTSSNWTAGVPSSSLDAVIGDRLLTRYPVINSSARCRSLTIGGLFSASLTLNSTLTVDADVTINSNGSIIQAAGTSLSVSNNVSINSGGTLTHQGNSSLTFSGDFTCSGTFNSSSSSTVLAGGMFGTQTISGTNLTFNNLTIYWFVMAYAAANIKVNGILTISPISILDLQTNTLSGAVTTVSGTGTLKTQNTSSAPIPDGLSWPGAVYYNSTSAQTIVNGSYSNVDATGGNRTFDPTATIGISGTFTPGVGSYTVLGSTVEFNGSSAQNIPSCLFYNLTVNNAAGVTLTGAVKIINSLGFGNVNNSVITTGGFLTLASSSSNTANLLDITNSGANSGNKITGLVTVERYVTGKRAYRFLASAMNTTTSIKANWMGNANNTSAGVSINPVPGYGTQITGAGGSTNGFDVTATNNASLFTFNNETQAWIPAANTSNVLAAGTGYRIMVRGDRSIKLTDNNAIAVPTTLRATGTLVTNSVTFAKAGGAGTTGMPTLSTVTNNYNFIANPYAASIDWSKVTATNFTDVSPWVYVFDPTITGSNGRGGYVSYDAKNNKKSNASSKINNYIQSGQAFFVQTTGPNPSITLQESYKATTVLPVFRTAIEVPKMDIQLLLPDQVNGTGSADGTAIYFSDDYSNSVDYDDSYKFINQDENIAILRDGKPLSVEARKPVAGADSIPLKLWQLSSKNYTLKIRIDNFSDNVETYLEDKFLNITTPLFNGETLVPFSITSDAASSASNRFKIVFESFATLPVRLTGIKAYEKNKGVQVEWSAESESNIDLYEVEKSADAQHFVTIGSTKAKNNPSVVASYNAFDVSPYTGDNYYRVKTVEKSGDVRESEIVKVNIAGTKSAITVVTNPIRGHSVNLLFKNAEKGTYSARLINAAGENLLFESITYTGGTSFVQLQMKSAVPAGVYQLQLVNGTVISNLRVLVQ